jgi:hypothetical protein
VKRLIGIMLAAVVGAGVVGAPMSASGQLDDDLDKLELMLHGLIAVHASAVMAMKAYDAGLISKEEAETEIARNEKLLALLARCGNELKRGATTASHEDLAFIQDYLQVCEYLRLALDAFRTYIANANTLDQKLFDRYLLKGEQTMTRLLQSS